MGWERKIDTENLEKKKRKIFKKNFKEKGRKFQKKKKEKMKINFSHGEENFS